mgnify:CR=1 FL=1
MNLKKLKKNFDKNGFIKIDLIDKKKIIYFKNFLYKIIINKIFNIDKNYYNKYKNNVDKILNQGMIFLDKVNHDHLVEIYKQVPKSNFFYSIFGDKKLNNVVSYLLTGKKIHIHHFILIVTQ